MAERAANRFCSLGEADLRAEPPVTAALQSQTCLEISGGVGAKRPKMEARAGIEPAMEVLQTSALPLGYRAIFNF